MVIVHPNTKLSMLSLSSSALYGGKTRSATETVRSGTRDGTTHMHNRIIEELAIQPRGACERVALANPQCWPHVPEKPAPAEAPCAQPVITCSQRQTAQNLTHLSFRRRAQHAGSSDG